MLAFAEGKLRSQQYILNLPASCYIDYKYAISSLFSHNAKI